MTISITRALSELKLLNKKINDQTNLLELAGYTKSISDETEKTKFITGAMAGLQKVQDLIARRNLLKTAIVKSNAETTVYIGGVGMTVAAAIEKKTSIILDKELLSKMRSEYYGSKQYVEQQNEKVAEKAEQQAKTFSDGSDTTASEDHEDMVKRYIKRNELTLLTIKDLDKKIQELQDKIDNFEHEVDFILDESNTKTTIDV